MPRFFVDYDFGIGDISVISGSDARHIYRVLRLGKGDTVTVCNKSGSAFECRITDASSDTVTVSAVEAVSRKTEPPCFITLYQGLPKGDKADYIIQKSVECGVGRIVFFESERCVARIKQDSIDKKLQRWRKISESAAKQSGRAVVPEIAMPVSFKTAAENVSSGNDLNFICYEGVEVVPLGNILKETAKSEKLPENISFFVGPEGGFEKSEVDYAVQHGIKAAGLGGRILRCETASCFVLACLSYEFELFE